MTNKFEAGNMGQTEQREPRPGALTLTVGKNPLGIRFVETYNVGETTFVGVVGKKGGAETYMQASGQKEHLPTLLVGALKHSIGFHSGINGLNLAGLSYNENMQEASVTLEREGQQFTSAMQNENPDVALMGAIMNGFQQAVA